LGSLVDRNAFPRTAAYVAALPNGLDSYPQCRARTDVNRVVLERFPKLLEHGGVDPSLVQRLVRATRAGDWMTEVEAVTTRLMVRDTALVTDTAYRQWNHAVAAEVFSRPMYRVLMYVMSPTLVLMGASKRWAAFREGTTLVSRADKSKRELELSYPPKLYTEIVLHGIGEAFRAALVAAGAKEPLLDLDEAGAEKARWRVSWT
jgi:hypothetical protein